MNAVVEKTSNPFGSRDIAERENSAVAESEIQRSIAEIQGMLVIAKRFPRDRIAAMDRILQDCTRASLAESALYSYARGGSEVTGPSIRLAESLAQNWGNIDFGIKELSQGGGASQVMAVAIDLETLTRQFKVFTVPHIRYTRQGSKRLEDPRDIYEMVANQGARRLRACILGVIPGDVIEAAVAQCEATLHAKVDVTPELIKTLIEKFADYGVSKEQIEKRIQRRIESIQPAAVVQLRKIYNSMKDGMSSAGEWFETAPIVETATGKPVTGASALKAAVTKTPPAVNKATGEIATDPMTDDDDPTLGIPGAGDISHVGNGAPAVNFEALLQRLKTGTSLDTLDADASLIGEVGDFEQRNVLTKAYQVRRAELAGGKKK